jgi:hypothetical protein
MCKSVKREILLLFLLIAPASVCVSTLGPACQGFTAWVPVTCASLAEHPCPHGARPCGSLLQVCHSSRQEGSHEQKSSLIPLQSGRRSRPQHAWRESFLLTIQSHGSTWLQGRLGYVDEPREPCATLKTRAKTRTHSFSKTSDSEKLYRR